jgi:hypothetical protein
LLPPNKDMQRSVTRATANLEDKTALGGRPTTFARLIDSI